MWKYVIKRIILAFITVFIILSLTFILLKMLPFSKPGVPDPGKYGYYKKQVFDGFVLEFFSPQSNLGELLWSYTPPGEARTSYFYQVPVMTQYFSMLKNIVTKWNWGTSTYIKPNFDAFTIIRQRLPASIKVNIIAVLISTPLGIILGIVAALKKNKPADHIISISAMIFISVPGFVLITFLMLILCYKTNILPSQWPLPDDPFYYKVQGYILPVMCLSFGSIAGYSRFTRAELCEVISSEYLLLARTKGLTKRQAIIRHALRNAMVPIVPSIIGTFLSILGGSMILENLYGIPGIGRLYIDAISNKDYNVLMVDMAVFITFALLSGVLVDISYGFIDPRIKMGRRK